MLENYKDMIFDATNDLGTHLGDIQEKIDRLKAGDAAAIDEVAIEWQSMLEEKQSTQHGLNMCAQLSTLIAQFESTSKEHQQFSDRPSAHKHVKSGLDEVGSSVQSLVTRLRSHEASISSMLEAMSLNDGVSEPVAAQLARLQQTKESISQCIQIVSEARESAEERSNIFEDITLAENSYAFSVSTVNDLVTARRLNLSGRSRHFGGQVTNDTVQKSMEALTNLDAEHLKRLPPTPRGEYSSGTDPTSPSDTRQFHDRFGPGNSLSIKRTN